MSLSWLRAGILLSIGVMFLMVACANRPPLSPEENYSPSNTREENPSGSPLKTAIVGRWQCTGNEPIWNGQESQWEFYDNGDVMMASFKRLVSDIGGKYTFMSQDNIKIEWQNETFIRYDISLSGSQLTLSSVGSILACQRL